MFNFLPTFLALQSSRRALRDGEEESNVPLKKGEVIFISILMGILIAMTIGMVIAVILLVS